MSTPERDAATGRTGDAGGSDPRLLRSRNRLLDAATQLLDTGGVEAVTVEAVTRISKVARATLYRHFGSTTHLLAATFERLLPRVQFPPEDLPLRDRLVELLTAQAELAYQAPVQMTTLAWLSMYTLGEDEGVEDPDAIASLRERMLTDYREPFDAVLASSEAREQLGEVDSDFAIAQLFGPIAFARLTGMREMGRDDCARLVDDFLTAHQRRGDCWSSRIACWAGRSLI